MEARSAASIKKQSAPFLFPEEIAMQRCSSVSKASLMLAGLFAFCSSASGIDCWIDDNKTCAEALGLPQDHCFLNQCVNQNGNSVCEVGVQRQPRDDQNIDWVTKTSDHPNRQTNWQNYYPLVYCYEEQPCNSEDPCINHCSADGDWGNSLNTVTPRRSGGAFCHVE